MNRTAQFGAACTGIGLALYIAGVVQPYPGRELSLIAVFLGITIYAIGGGLP